MNNITNKPTANAAQFRAVFFYETLTINCQKRRTFYETFLFIYKNKNPANQDLRHEMKQNGIHMWVLANKYNVCEMTVSRWFRLEMPDERKVEIRRVIAEIKGGEQ